MDSFLGTIVAFGFNFAPYSWAQCQGQIMNVSTNTALFSLLGTYYGGNGTSTFGLPNLQGSAAVGYGQGPNLSNYLIGETGGSNTAMLSGSNMPMHAHGLVVKINAMGAVGTTSTVAGNYPANTIADKTVYNAAPSTGIVMAGAAAITLGTTGSATPVSVQRPYLTSNYCIALAGIYPTRQ